MGSPVLTSAVASIASSVVKSTFTKAMKLDGRVVDYDHVEFGMLYTSDSNKLFCAITSTKFHKSYKSVKKPTVPAYVTPFAMNDFYSFKELNRNLFTTSVPSYFYLTKSLSGETIRQYKLHYGK